MCYKIFTRVSLGLIVALCTPLTKAQTSGFKEAMNQAFERSLEMELADAAVQKADENVVTSYRAWFPEASVNATGQVSFDNNRGQKQTVFGPSELKTNTQANTTRGIVELKQNLYAGGGTMATMEISERQMDVATLDYKLAEQKTLLDSLAAYVNLITERELLKNEEHNVMFYEKQLSAAEIKFEVGEETIASVESIRSKLEGAKAKFLDAKRRLVEAESTYIRFFGALPISKIELPELPNGLPSSAEEAMKIALENNLELKKLDRAVDIAKATVDATYAELLPSFDLSVTGSRTLGSTIGAGAELGRYDRTRTNNATFLATLRVPLDIRGLSQAKVRAARYAAAEERLKSMRGRRDYLNAVIANWEKYITHKQTLNRYQAEIKSSKIALDSIQEEYAVGTATYLNVIEAEQQALEAFNNAVSNRRNILLSAYTLLATIGTLSRETLGFDEPISFSRDNDAGSLWGTGIGTFNAFDWQSDPVINAYDQFGKKGV